MPLPTQHTSTALLTFSIGPVHTFIIQARRVADLWAGSQLLSDLMKKAVGVARQHGELVHPSIEGEELPDTLTNRFVCRLPESDAERIAVDMSHAVQDEWHRLVLEAAKYLTGKPYEFQIDPRIWPGGDARAPQAEEVIQTSWSWVSEEGDYEQASGQGAALSQGSRLFRPFTQKEESLEKCAVCGERTALPNGHRQDVRQAWNHIAEIAEEKGNKKDIPFFRAGQTRLCLVCSTKRLFPKLSSKKGVKSWKANAYALFEPFESYQVDDDRRYFALVAMDGDHLSRVFGWSAEKLLHRDIQGFHHQVSRCLTEFADSLQTPRSAELCIEKGENFTPANPDAPPQLIFAGGEDVRFVCHARDALPLARIIRVRYRQLFRDKVFSFLGPDHQERLTISAGILYAHVKHSAGLLFRDVTTLLDEKAKREAGRDAVALRIDKRSGEPVEIAFKWDEPMETGVDTTWLEGLNEIVGRIAAGELSSSSSFDLRQDEKTLRSLFTGTQDWRSWLAQQLRRDGATEERAEQLAALLAPFFFHQKTEALRIARFLGREVHDER